MDLSAFFGVVSTIDFALLGLWWVAVQTRPDLRSHEFRTSTMAYLVSLQFLVPGTATLFAQVSSGLDAVWRIAFGLAGLSGLAAILALAPRLAANGERRVAGLLGWLVAPLQVLITVVALYPQVIERLHTHLYALQVEAMLFCLMVFLGAQTAWAAAMQPERAPAELERPEARTQQIAR